MIIFKTKRLIVKPIEEKDKEYFIELFTDSEIINLIPQQPWELSKIIEKFDHAITHPKITESNDLVIWGVYENLNNDLMGLCAILKNDEDQREIGYRFRKSYWRKGYGTELTKSLIDYCFTVLNFQLITADVNITNIGSVKILDKFFKPLKEFYNTTDNCIDRRYILENRNK